MSNRIKDKAFSERLRYLRRLKGVGQKKVAEDTGISSSSIQRYEYGERPTLKYIAKLVEYYGCSKAWLIDGEGEPFPGARAKYPEVCGPELTSPFPYNGTEKEFVYIPQMAGRISAGGGLVPDDYVEIKLAFRLEWIKRKGNPENMALIKIAGDSMEPTLLSGDLVLIDRSRNYLDPQGGIYAIAVDNVIMIKRLQAEYPARKVKIISDNRHYPDIEADPDKVKITGKVIWFGRELER